MPCVGIATATKGALGRRPPLSLSVLRISQEESGRHMGAPRAVPSPGLRAWPPLGRRERAGRPWLTTGTTQVLLLYEDGVTCKLQSSKQSSAPLPPVLASPPHTANPSSRTTRAWLPGRAPGRGCAARLLGCSFQDSAYRWTSDTIGGPSKKCGEARVQVYHMCACVGMRRCRASATRVPLWSFAVSKL